MTYDSLQRNFNSNLPPFTFMAYKLTDNGVEPDPAKVAAITGDAKTN